MTTTEPQEHQIFSEWTLYRKVVDNDYMEHTAVAREVERALRGVAPGRSLLDLGCGDAEIVSRLATDRRLGTYLGVDQSQAALDSARQRLEGLVDELDFEKANLLEFVRTTTLRFDVILCGYALHHLDTGQKRDFFRYVHRVLKRGGVLIAYDAFHQEFETRQEFLETYIEWIADEWTEIRPEEHAVIATHMREADLPETLDTFCQLVLAAGLRPTHEPLWSCKQNFHHLLRITH